VSQADDGAQAALVVGAAAPEVLGFGIEINIADDLVDDLS
jgi:hypothetical protein